MVYICVGQEIYNIFLPNRREAIDETLKKSCAKYGKNYVCEIKRINDETAKVVISVETQNGTTGYLNVYFSVYLKKGDEIFVVINKKDMDIYEPFCRKTIIGQRGKIVSIEDNWIGYDFGKTEEYYIKDV